MTEDRRLVRTAVIGNEHSDVPVLLPLTAIEHLAFRKVHDGDTYWCGLLLGGCGAQLYDKLYTDGRVCHFQHKPAPSGERERCGRRGIGERSADHLYLKAAMEKSLASHGRAARFLYPDPIGSLVDMEFEDGRLLRVHLDGQVRPVWDGTSPILGEDVVVDPGTWSRCPYVYRVRVDSDGDGRRVWIGTERLAHPTQWVPLADCGWDEDGLVTEAAQQAMQSPVLPPPAAAPRVPEKIKVLVDALERAQRSGSVEMVRRLVAGADDVLADVNEAARADAEDALSEARTWLDGHTGYQQEIFGKLEQAVREQRVWDVRSILSQAEALTRLGASEAEQRILQAARALLRQRDHPVEAKAPVRVPVIAPRARPSTRTRAAKTPVTAPARDSKRRAQQEQELAADRARTTMQVLLHKSSRMSARARAAKAERLREALVRAPGLLTKSERRVARSLVRANELPAQPGSPGRRPMKEPARSPRREPEALPAERLKSAASAVRGALKRTAREQRTVTWDQLRDQLGSALPRMCAADRRQMLLLVDGAAQDGEPLLSSVLAAADPHLAEPYRLSVVHHGGYLPEDDREMLREVIDADVQATHRYWRHR
ncbi:hypothetical protein [Streptomyces sp. Da 82-17]|uniref:hypothetical protein n=1 Tax=Streptomyces sp. Da 82-17 TaxID=3377116 RepID=UPI0038D39AE2